MRTPSVRAVLYSAGFGMQLYANVFREMMSLQNLQKKMLEYTKHCFTAVKHKC